MSAIIDIPLKLINHENKGVRWLSFAVLLIIATAWSTLKYADVKAEQKEIKVRVEQSEKRIDKFESAMEDISKMKQSLSNIEGYLKGRDGR